MQNFKHPMTLSAFLWNEVLQSGLSGMVREALLDVSISVKKIAKLTQQGALSGCLGALETKNIQGEQQKKLDVIAHQILVEDCARSGTIAAIASEEEECIHPIHPQGQLLLLFDPLDGSSNTDINVSVGTIFSLYQYERPEQHPTEADFLCPGRQQLAAGYALYGPATVLMLTVGRGTHEFTLDREIGEFFLTRAHIQIPKTTAEFAINASNQRFWEMPVQRYIQECLRGELGPREKTFNMRWIASMVADVHRILSRGGIFLYPRDHKDASKPGRLRLLYEANPMAMLVEQAGGVASTGHRGAILSVQPETLHQRIAVILGSEEEVLCVEQYYQEAGL